MNKKSSVKEEKRKRLVLLDAHAILHRSYHGMPDLTDKNGNPTGALYGYISMISRIKNDLMPDYIASCYDLPKPTFRHLAYDNYKGTRSATDDELKMQIDISYDICKGLNIPIYTAEGFEADDLLGTIAKQMGERHPDIEVIIASGDMDTMQLINDTVKVYTLKKGSETAMYDYDAVVARYGFTPKQIPDYKSIAGDTSDNIIGVPGIGVKGATELIQKYGSLENLYNTIEKEDFDFKAAGMRERMYNLLVENKDGAEFSRVLATIRTDAPVTYEPIDWIVNKTDYVAICDRFGFRSLREKFDDYVADAPLVATLQASPQEAHPHPQVDEHKYADLKTMMNLINSEMVNVKVEQVLEYLELENENRDERLFEKAREKLITELRNMKVANIQTSPQPSPKKREPLSIGIDNMYDYYKIVEEPIIAIIEQMRINGVQVSKEILLEQSNKLHLEIEKLEKRIYELADGEFNLNSPKQLGEILYDKMGLGIKIKKTKTGQKSTGIEMLESMRDEHEIIPLIISYRELFKLVSTYIDTLPDFIEEDGRIHARLILNGAATGRFSCEHPNLQNLPAKIGAGMEIRKAFQAASGKKLLSLDYSQIELRLAAIMSGDKNLLKIFEDGTDVHSGVAALVYNKDASEINSDERRHAKAINFGILYGMGVTALKDSMGVERIVAQEFYDKYKQNFPTLMGFLERVKAEARELGYTHTLFGRRRQIPLIKSKLPFMRAQGERIAINAPIQGTGAELIKMAMVDIQNANSTPTPALPQGEGATQNTNLRLGGSPPLEGGFRWGLILQIHDELIFEIDEHDDTSKVEFKKIMENVLKKRGIDIIPIAVGTAEGKDMFELK